ncbi:MAG: glycosyltransferase family 2 protein, partial [Gemmataceae bacterium]|nr:glycosyltransferase family 2 protein [Gemmataceae bacterium]
MTTALAPAAPTKEQATAADGLAELAPELAPLLERMAADPNTRVALLEQLLGVNACRQIGIYPIPKGFKLSVVIPV